MIQPCNLRLPKSLISELQKPFGTFFKLENGLPKPENRVIDYIKLNNKHLVVVVGDYVSKSLLDQNYIPSMIVIDNYTQRTNKYQITLPKNHEIRNVENLPGEINKNAWLSIKNEFKNFEKKSSINKTTNLLVILAQGEEDLLTLPVILEAPLGCIVLYGQPPMIGDGSSGIVLIEVTKENKSRINQLLNKFDRI